MVHSCPDCRVFLSFQRKETINPDLVSGHWYGCPGCARNVCADCGRASGRRCRECGATLEPDQFFPRELKPLEDWRQYLPSEEDLDLRNSLELIACATEASMPEMDAALDDWSRDAFREEIFTYELMRRLGSTDYFTEWGSTVRELRWTPEWERRLAVAAAYYRDRAEPAALEALELRELLRGWSELVPASRSALADILEATLHPDERVAEEALRVFDALAPPAEEVLAWSIPVLRSRDARKVLAGLATLRKVRRWGGPELDRKASLALAPRVCEALAERTEPEVEALVRRMLFTQEPWRMDVLAVAIVALGLTGELVPVLDELLASRRSRARLRGQSFLASLGEPAAMASIRARFLEGLSRAGTPDGALWLFMDLEQWRDASGELLPHLERWTDTGPPRKRLEVLRFLIEALGARASGGSEALRVRCQQVLAEVRTGEDRMALIKLLFWLEPEQRGTLFPGLPAPAELLYSLLRETDGSFAASVQEEGVKELLGMPHARAWLMSHAAREPRHYLTILTFRMAGPECEGLLMLLQRLLADRSAGPADRERWVETLGRISQGPQAPACPLLRQVFLDARESVSTRRVAARSLWLLGVRGLPGPELAPALSDRSAMVRSWALLLADEVPGALFAPLRDDPSPLVRWVLSRAEPGK